MGTSFLHLGYTIPDALPLADTGDKEGVGDGPPGAAGGAGPGEPVGGGYDAAGEEADGDRRPGAPESPEARRASDTRRRHLARARDRDGAESRRFAPGAVEPLVYDGPLHGLTIAPTGAGKGRCMVIPNLLKRHSQVVAIDVKGELAAVTGQLRRQLGQPVYVVDPLSPSARARRQRTAAINPFDIFDTAGSDDDVHVADEIAYHISETTSAGADGFGGGYSGANHAYWENSARGLLKGVILLVRSLMPRREQHLGTLYKLLHSDDVVYNLAVYLDNHPAKKAKRTKRAKPAGPDKTASAAKDDDDDDAKSDGGGTAGRKQEKASKTTAAKKALRRPLHPVAHSEIAAFLQTTEVTRSGILSTAQSYLKLFGDPRVRASLGRTSFRMADFTAGKPMSVFLVLPPDKLKSHAPLLRMWIATMMKCAFSRTELPPEPTLLMLDEAAQLGHLDDLETAITLGRSYGLQVWSFWQDAAQLRKLYPASWQTVLNNCGFVNGFGPRNPWMRKEFAALFGVDDDTVASLAPDEQLVMVEGKVIRAWLPDYLTDSTYAGLADPNPFFRGHEPAM